MAYNPNKELKKYYGIAEVAEQFNVAESLLRFWEKEFSNINPKKSGRGVRMYTKEDIEEVRLVYNLLKVRGMKIAAAKQVLSKNRKAASETSEIIDRLQSVRAELKEITGGKVPGGTPVILELSSNKASDNKVMPLNENITKIQGNELAGRYFCYILLKGHGNYENENTTGKELKNALEFDKNTMRVLGVKDGKLAMVTENDKAFTKTRKEGNTTKYYYYMPANKAYLPIKKTESSATNITLLRPDEYEVALSISKVTTEKSTKPGIYTLTGVKVKEDNNTSELPSGIYIIDGKKQVIK